MSKLSSQDNEIIEKTPLCLINLYYKLKSKIENEKSGGDSDKEISNEIYTATTDQITAKISKLIEKLFQNYRPEIQQSNVENSSSQVSKEDLTSEYESMIQKLEAEVRSHIRLEQQLKLHLDSLQSKIEESEKAEENNKKTIQILNDEIKQLKNEKNSIEIDYSKLKEKNEGLEKKSLSYFQHKTERSSRVIKKEESKERKNQLKKIQKGETRNEGGSNKSELCKKIQQITSKKIKIAGQKDIEHSMQKLIRKTTENSSKLNELKTITKENSLWSNKSQSIISKRHPSDNKTISMHLKSELKRNSENISKEIMECSTQIKKKQNSFINSGILSKRVINGKTQQNEIYKTINHTKDAQIIHTARQKESIRESLDKNNSLSNKLKKFTNQKYDNLSKTNICQSSNIPKNSLFMNKKKEEDDLLSKHDEASESIGKEANICEKNIDIVNRRARSITYQYGATFNKFSNPNTSALEPKI